MSVKLRLSKFFSLYVENRDWVEVDGHNLGECLDNLINLFTNIKDKFLPILELYNFSFRL